MYAHLPKCAVGFLHGEPLHYLTDSIYPIYLAMYTLKVYGCPPYRGLMYHAHGEEPITSF